MKHKTIVIDWSYYKGTVPGYGDTRAVPGEYACLLPDRGVVTSFSGFTGQAGLPGENINYIRIPRKKGDGRIAGGGQNTDRTLEWDVDHWAPRGLMYGPNAVIYDAQSKFVQIASRQEYKDTAGWRFAKADNTLVNCESTYADKARGIYEWTDFGDVRIGQGADGIAVVDFPGEPLRVLDPRPVSERGRPADMRFMHIDRSDDGDLFGCAIPELKGRKTYFVYPTWAELKALPFVGAAPIPIPPNPEPPKPEPPVPTDYLGINQRVRAKYSTPLGAQHWVYLVDLAQQTGTLLFKKDGGDHVMVPPLNVFVSLDVVGRGTLGDNWADVLGDAEGAAVPTWNVSPNAAGTYVDVSGVQLPGGPQPPEPPNPQPPSGDLEARVASLESWRAAVGRVT